jgi:hypothetical protein
MVSTACGRLLLFSMLACSLCCAGDCYQQHPCRLALCEQGNHCALARLQVNITLAHSLAGAAAASVSSNSSKQQT